MENLKLPPEGNSDQIEDNDALEVKNQGDKEPSTQEVMETLLAHWESHKVEMLKLGAEQQGFISKENVSPLKEGLETKMRDTDMHLSLEGCEGLNKGILLVRQTQNNKVPTEVETLIFKEIGVSPTRNLNDSFEGTMDSSSGQD